MFPMQPLWPQSWMARHVRPQQGQTQPTKLRIVLSDGEQSDKSGSSTRVWHSEESIEGHVEVTTAMERACNVSVYFEGSPISHSALIYEDLTDNHRNNAYLDLQR